MNVLVTVTFNAVKDGILAPFLACIQAQKSPDFRLLIIDNASWDGTAAYLDKLDMPGVDVILNQENVGFARACNQGIAFARRLGARYVTFINNDTEFDANLIGDMVDSLNQTGAVGLSPLVTYYSDPERIWFATGSYRAERGIIPYHDRLNQPRSTLPKDRILDTSFISGCCFLIRMDAFDTLVGFDERYFVYWEDADLCRTMGTYGMRLVTDTALECRHKVSVSTGGAFSDFSVYNFTFGHMIFIRKHYAIRNLAWVLPLISAKTLVNVLRGRMKLRQLSMWLSGLMAGLRIKL